MKLEAVQIKGFRSIRDGIEFVFSDRPGLVKLTGRNEVTPRLATNGTGKSSFWEAIYWCLFGKTSKGLRGPDVVSWGRKHIQVTIRVAGRVLTRTWGGKNTLTLDGDDVTQEQVEEWVKLTPEQALHCYYFSQRGKSFLDLGAQAKTDLLSQVLGLDKWLDKSAAADARAKQIEIELDDLRTLARELSGKVDEISSIDYAERAAAHEQEVEEKLAVLGHRIKKNRAHVDSVLTPFVERYGREESTAFDDVQRAESRLAVIKGKVRDAEEHLAAHEKGRACPACKRPFNDAAPLTASSRRALEDEIDALQEDADAARAKVARLRDAYDAARKNLDDAKEELSAAKTDIAAMSRAIDMLNGGANPYSKLARERDERVAQLRKRLADVEDQIPVLEPELERVQYWVKAFKDVRLFLVAEALGHLEVEVNAALARRGLVGWSITFAPDAETKSGTIKRGFTVTVMAPGSTKSVPWEAWSGGEAQRLRTAADAGLASLIADYTGFESFVEVWDEPSSGINNEGIEDLLDVLRDRCIAEGKQVWVVDHHALESGYFDETVVAVKSASTTTFTSEVRAEGE